jgi:ABC-type uncharacterized transport system substrate-binding protein
MGSYLAFIAGEVYTNRFFEFIQSDKVDESLKNLPSVFGEEHRQAHINPIFKVDYELPLEIDSRFITYWVEYFGRFQFQTATVQMEREKSLKRIQDLTGAKVAKIIENLKKARAVSGLSTEDQA